MTATEPSVLSVLEPVTDAQLTGMTVRAAQDVDWWLNRSLLRPRPTSPQSTTVDPRTLLTLIAVFRAATLLAQDWRELAPEDVTADVLGAVDVIEAAASDAATTPDPWTDCRVWLRVLLAGVTE